MPGIVYRVLSRTRFDMSGIQTSGGTAILLAAKGIDASTYTQAVVTVRFHDADWPTGSSVTVSARLDAPTDEDTRDFTTSTDLASATFNKGTDSPPTVKVFTVTAPFTPWLRIYVKGYVGMSYVGNFVTVRRTASLTGWRGGATCGGDAKRTVRA